MSDWELDDTDTSGKSTQKVENPSDWEISPEEGISPSGRESLGYSVAAAIPRIFSDVAKSAYGFANKVPGYLESAKTEVPGVISAQMQHPIHSRMQELAGANELINKVAQFPLNLSRYGTDRLHLVPEGVTKAIEKITPSDTTEAINKLFGQPQYPGEALMRGTIRDIPELLATGKVADFLNPMNLTSKTIAKNVVKEGERQQDVHSQFYNKLWNDASQQGITNVPYDLNRLQSNFDTISKYKTPKEYESLVKFSNNPTLENAQKAQSDMSQIARKLEEKSRSSSLTSEEQNIYKAAKDSEKHIEGNMFKDQNGNVNQSLKNKYDYITKSYRENVVPYKYNSDIQAFKNKELLAKELRQRLSKGEFAAKKGSEHPELFRADQIKNALIGLGIAGGISAGGKSLSDYLSAQKVPDYIYGK